MMNNLICKRWPNLAFTVFFFFLSHVGIVQGQPQLFSDDFSTNNNVNYVTAGVLGSSSWTAYRSAVDWGVRINTIPAQLEISNDISASANQIGWAYANASFSASCFSNTLSSNLGQVIWTFNMRQSDLNPEGFSSGDNGLAFILAGSNVNVNNTGNGYAVVLGQSGTTDAIRLVSYTNGLSGTLNNLIISNTAGVTDISSEYISVKVVYTPATNLWELFLRNDGASFINPNTGLLTSQGSIVNNTYTSVSLGQTGAYYQGGTIAQNAFFDNVGVQVLLSVPTSSGTTINCGQTATLSASGSPLSYAWYGDPNGNTLLGTGASFTTPSLTTSTTYYVSSSSVSTGTQSFSYTGGQQSFTAPITGSYTLETWGAAGGTSYSMSQMGYINGGKGGYAKRVVTLTAGQTIYIHVGGQGAIHTPTTTGVVAGGYNGGGFSSSTNTAGGGGGGGGATHISTTTGLLSGLSSNQASVLVVAGGGGGAWACNQYSWSDYRDGSEGGAGGGSTGQGSGYGYTMGYTTNPVNNNIFNQNDTRSQAYNYTTGGTQTAGGAQATAQCCNSFYGTSQASAFGQGASSANTGSHSGGGGGGGWYGGGAGASGENANGTGGGGGSSYNANDPNGQLIAGIASMPNPAGGFMVGRSGDGIAKISWNLPGCSSNLVPVTVNVITTPAPTVTPATIGCGASATLTATGAGNYFWYSDSTAVTQVGTGSSFTTPNLNNSTTYYIRSGTGICASAISSVLVTVNTGVANPTVSGTNINCGLSTTLTASGSTGNYAWYDNANGTNLLGTGANFTTPALTASTTYYVRATAGLPVNQFYITSLANTSATFYEHNTYSGDDRGGIAVTQQYYYYVGDNNTVRYDMPNLTNPVSYTRRDGIFSDLSGNGTLYTLWNFTNNSEPVGTCTSFSVNSIRTLNSDCTLGATTIPLSQSFTMGSCSDAGIFSGYGFLIIFTGSGGVPANTFYRIDIPSGQVTNLGTRTFSSTGTENWSRWGIAEFNGTDYSIVYVQSSTTISRMNMTSGSVTTVQSFSSLSDMACITYSPWHNRWYYHHEGGSQWGGSDESAGFLNGTHFASAVGSCGSSMVPVTVSILPVTTPNVTGASITCGQSTTLTATNSGNYYWYSDSTAINLLGTGATYTTGALSANTIFYVQSGTGACASAMASALVTVSSNIALPTASNQSIACGNTATLTASGSPSTYAWYADPAGNTLLGTGATFTTASLTTSTTYYVKSTSLSQGSQTFNYTGAVQSFTAPSSGNYTLELWGAEGGKAYSLSQNGLINGGKGGYVSRTVSLTAGQTIYIYVGGEGATHQSTSSGVIAGGYNGGGASSGTNTAGGGGGGGGATHIATVSGLLSTLSGNQSAVLAVGAGGGGAWGCVQYQWTQYRDGSEGGAGGGTTGQGAGYGYTMGYTQGNANNNIMNQADTRSQAYNYATGGSQTAGGIQGTIQCCNTFYGTSVPSAFGLGASSANTASHSGGGGGGGWYGGGAGASGENANGTGGGGGSSYTVGGQNIAGNASMPNPAGGNMTGRSGNGIVKITWNQPGCSSALVPVTVTVNTLSTPVSNGASINCGQTATLTASGSSNYFWYSNPTATTQVGTGNSFTTPALSGTTYYYLQSGTGSCASSIVPVLVNVNSGLPNPTVSNQTINCGQTASITASGSPNTYAWYADSTGTNNLATGSTFITPLLTTTTTYYVRSTSLSSGSQLFNYTGAAQSFTAPVSGTYTLEAWGAQGGNDPQSPTTIFGGRGAYSSGEVYLTAGTTIHIFVGQQGSGCTSSTWWSTGGGGATDFRLVGGNWNDNAGLYSRILVAGGGGGRHGKNYENATYVGNDGGGTAAPSYVANGTSITGSNQTSGGNSNYGSSVVPGSFGFATPNIQSNSCSVGGWNGGARGSDNWANGGAGGGWFGGCTSWPTSSGGSGYAYTSSSWTPVGYTPSAAYQLTNSQLIAGNTTMPNPAGGNMTGNSGNGVAKITWSQPGCSGNLVPVTVTVNQNTLPVASGTTISCNQTATLNASGSTNYFWFTDSLATNQVGTGASFTTPNLYTNTRYFVRSGSGVCATASVPVLVTVSSTVAAPTVNSQNVACNGSATLTATGSTGNYAWYSDPNGINLLGTGSSFTTASLTTTTTYYVSATNYSVGSQLFNYTGSAQSFTAPATGTYTLEAWGAQGGNDPQSPTTIFGGRGAYSSGEVYLTAGTTIYIFVGQQGSGCTSSTWWSTGGGGATDFRLVGGNWNDNAGLYSRILVAGGGGGRHGKNYENATYVGNDGGGTAAPSYVANGTSITGSNQTSGGNSNYGSSVVPGSFGFATPNTQSNSCSVGGWNGGARGSDNWANGGAGGGWFGGCTSWPTSSGGSGYAYTSSSWTPVGYTPSAAYQLTNTQLIAGNTTMPNPAGGNMTGNSGNGVAKITWNQPGCSSSPVPVTVSVNPVTAPTANGTTISCGQTSTLNASGTSNYEWFADSTATISLSTNASYTTPALSFSTTYYVRSTSGGCLSNMVAVPVTVNPITGPTASGTTINCGTNTTLTATGNTGTYLWYSDAQGNNLLFTGSSYLTSNLNTNTTFYVRTSSGACLSALTPVTVNINALSTTVTSTDSIICQGQSATLSSSLAGNYLWSNGSTTANITVSPSANSSYAVTVTTTGGCTASNSYAITVNSTAAPTANSNQSFCNTATLADLVATGTNIQWYDAAVNGNLLALSTPLVDNASYFASQTVNACQSTQRTQVTVSLTQTAAPTANSNQSFCNAATLADLVATGTNIQWYDAAVNGNLLTLSTPLVDNASYFASQTVNACQSTQRTQVTVSLTQTAAPTANSNQSFCNAATLADLVATGTNIQWYDAAVNGNLLSPSTALVNNASYFASQTVNACQSTQRTQVTISLTQTAAPTANSNQSFCNAATLADLVATGTNIQWYDAAVNGNLLALSTPLVNNASYFASQTVNACQSTQRTQVTVSLTQTAAPTAVSFQDFCNFATIADLVANGTNIQWYDAAVNGNLLSPSTALVNNVSYYATQTINACQSTQTTQVTALITNTNGPTADSIQSFCVSASLNDLVVTGTNVQWFDAPVGGNLLAPTTALAHNTNYYAFQTVNGCTSALPTVVLVQINGSPNAAVTSSAGSLTAVQSGASYQWIDCSNNTPLAGEINQTLIPPYTGTFAVYISLNGCVTLSNCTSFVITDVENVSATYYSIFPNPVISTLQVQQQGKQGKIQIRITDLLGRVLRRIESTDDLTQIEIDFAAGTYVIEITDEAGIVSNFKFVKIQ